MLGRGGRSAIRPSRATDRKRSRPRWGGREQEACAGARGRVGRAARRRPREAPARPGAAPGGRRGGPEAGPGQVRRSGAPGGGRAGPATRAKGQHTARMAPVPACNCEKDHLPPRCLRHASTPRPGCRPSASALGVIKSLDSFATENQDARDHGHDSLKLQAESMEEAMTGPTSLSTLETDINNLLQQVADDYEIEVSVGLPQTYAHTISRSSSTAAAGSYRHTFQKGRRLIEL
ncbi:hypothetical protein QYE76_010157 [Lolium multiflorum]|uniref:Uncharacterized protein n=1 Tax=Lolium multiflorum TaxID=4521 RepID=A0AAD8TT45_LOLMU|nr:hypothetical protein QYE76_010157 [Lolium multiflorum]